MKTSRWWTVAGLVIVAYSLFPLVWMLSLSMKPPSDIVSGAAVPAHDVDVRQLHGVFSQSLFTRALINSIGIALIATLFAVVVAMFAAYAIARLEFRGKRLLLSLALAIAMFPPGGAGGPAVQHVARDRHL